MPNKVGARTHPALLRSRHQTLLSGHCWTVRQVVVVQQHKQRSNRCPLEYHTACCNAQPSTKLAWKVIDEGAISGSQRCFFFHCRTQCFIDAAVHAAYVPSTCTPFYLLTKVLPVLLIGLACEALHVIPGFTIVNDGGVVYILENTETGSMLVSKGAE